ncbi:hypothetical protein [Chamaesiphon minutus]|uniref:Uncharacterized protein n=1 Tax=Chamaesiphon minutus (strain ATCC 27169 / PCC 6605) TaxID=1173020 RepID=K9UFX6_CHAP6|nr:hypothetical protein [Chamaesiphon minutus]AFY93720.1 hypothetical protein Cha6605_2678 [Chamaesiphon minutus PCC 6605]
MYSPSLAYFKTKSKLAYSGMAIAVWYLTIASSNANAQIPDPEPHLNRLDPNTLVTPRLASSTKSSPDDAGEDGAESVEHPATDPPAPIQVAQVTLPLPTLLAPLILPNLIPPSIPIVPINSVLTPDLLPPPNNTPAVPSPNVPVAPQPAKDPRFIIAPQVLDPKIVDPFSTQFVLNGNKVSHFTSTVAIAGFEAGNFRNTDLNFDVYKLIGARSIQSVTADRVVRVNTQLETVGIRNVVQNQDIAVSVAKPQTLLGFRQQISLDANCLNNPGQICTYLPGIKIDDPVIDPRKLQPTGARITSQFGDVISPASVAAIREPGFQGGANGQEFGIDITVPAVGLVPPPEGSPPPVLTGERQETFKNNVAVNYARLNQSFATNGVESTVGRTIRALNYVNGDRNQLANGIVNALGQVLPDFQPSIAPGKPGARIVVNPNLYRAANALRIPDNSLTVYQAGTGYAPSFGSDPRVPPGANHQAIWVGMSPVVEREFLRDYRYITLREPRIVASGGGEGGGVPIDVNLNGFGFNSGGLQNAYGQGYVTVFNRDVSRVDTDTIRQRTDYYPHISLTGTTLTENTLWRYYTGAIVNPGFDAKTTSNIKAYVGSDYSSVNPRGLSYSIGGVGYLNPDPEYYTQLFANATQSIGLGNNPRNNLVIGFNANYIIDGAITLQSLPIRTTQSFINAGLAFNFGDISIGGTQFFGNVLPESIDRKTVFNLNWKVTDRLKIGGFFTAFDNNISTNPFGANISYDLDPNSNSAIYLGWNAAEIDFRRTLGPTSNVYKDNTVSVSIKYGF